MLTLSLAQSRNLSSLSTTQLRASLISLMAAFFTFSMIFFTALRTAVKTLSMASVMTFTAFLIALLTRSHQLSFSCAFSSSFFFSAAWRSPSTFSFSASFSPCSSSDLALPSSLLTCSPISLRALPCSPAASLLKALTCS
ncbi:hypothetical protein D3C76_623630 [compost metagenome]